MNTTHTIIILESFVDYRLLEWLVKEGDTIKNGDSLFLVETDKVNAEIPSPLAGKIAGLKADVGDMIKVGDVVVLIEDGESSEIKAEKTEKPQTEEVREEEKSAGVVGEISVSNDLIPSFHTQESSSTSKKKKKILATPVARKMAKDLDVDIAEVKGTGTNGRVMKADIKKLASSKTKVPLKETVTASFTTPELDYNFGGPVEEAELSSTRKAISKAMAVSKQNIPHAVMMDEKSPDMR